MNRIWTILLLSFLVSAPALSAIDKIAVPSCGNSICLHWWPKLPVVKGWHHDYDASVENNANIQVPDRQTFAKAETVMYANAAFKPRIPKTKSLQQFIEDDLTRFRSEGRTIQEALPLNTDDGHVLRSYWFSPTHGGDWERVTYGEEGDYYLTFVISSRSKQGLDHFMRDYEKLIRDYKE